MSERPPLDLSVTTDDLQSLVRALRAEEDGKALRKQLARELKQALEPFAARARSAALAIPAQGPQVSPAIRPAIAKRIQPEIKLGGRWTGARLRARKTPNIRNFANAPKRTQALEGFHAPIFGTGRWRVQRGKPDWFDESLQGLQPAAAQAAQRVIEGMARRIAQRSN